MSLMAAKLSYGNSKIPVFSEKPLNHDWVFFPSKHIFNPQAWWLNLQSISLIITTCITVTLLWVPISSLLMCQPVTDVPASLFPYSLFSMLQAVKGSLIRLFGKLLAANSFIHSKLKSKIYLIYYAYPFHSSNHSVPLIPWMPNLSKSVTIFGPL